MQCHACAASLKVVRMPFTESTFQKFGKAAQRKASPARSLPLPPNIHFLLGKYVLNLIFQRVDSLPESGLLRRLSSIHPCLVRVEGHGELHERCQHLALESSSACIRCKSHERNERTKREGLQPKVIQGPCCLEKMSDTRHL